MRLDAMLEEALRTLRKARVKVTQVKYRQMKDFRVEVTHNTIKCVPKSKIGKASTL